MGHDPVKPMIELGARFPETARAAALAFASAVADGSAEVGKWAEFGDGVRGVCLVAGAASADALEYHKVYTDIHLTIQGCDRMHVGDSRGETIKAYDQNADFGLIKASDASVVSIGEGQFLEILPGVPHINLLDAGSVKIVYKIPDHA